MKNKDTGYIEDASSEAKYGDTQVLVAGEKDPKPKVTKE